MGLVDHAFVKWGVRWSVVTPVEEAIAHDGLRDVGCAVGGVGLGGVVEVVPEAGRVPVDVARNGLRIGVEQQLAGVAASTASRIPRTVDPIPVALAGSDVGQIGMPDVAIDLVEFDALFVTF